LTSGIKYVPRGLLVFLDNSEHKGKSEHEGEIGDYHIAGPITCDLATALNQNAGPIIMQGNLVRLRG
jgi:hypothetical protein